MSSVPTKATEPLTLVKMDMMCLESYPCQHHCILRKADGKLVKNTLSAVQLIRDHWQNLDDEARDHLAMYFDDPNVCEQL